MYITSLDSVTVEVQTMVTHVDDKEACLTAWFGQVEVHVRLSHPGKKHAEEWRRVLRSRHQRNKRLVTIHAVHLTDDVLSGLIAIGAIRMFDDFYLTPNDE